MIEIHQCCAFLGVRGKKISPSRILEIDHVPIIIVWDRQSLGLQTLTGRQRVGDVSVEAARPLVTHIAVACRCNIVKVSGDGSEFV